MSNFRRAPSEVIPYSRRASQGALALSRSVRVLKPARRSDGVYLARPCLVSHAESESVFCVGRSDTLLGDGGGRGGCGCGTKSSSEGCCASSVPWSDSGGDGIEGIATGLTPVH